MTDQEKEAWEKLVTAVGCYSLEDDAVLKSAALEYAKACGYVAPYGDACEECVYPEQVHRLEEALRGLLDAKHGLTWLDAAEQARTVLAKCEGKP